MFTGIIEEIGHIVSIQRHAFSQIITISASDILEETKVGDSIAVNGVCLTVTSIGSKQFSADVCTKLLISHHLEICGQEWLLILKEQCQLMADLADI